MSTDRSISLFLPPYPGLYEVLRNRRVTRPRCPCLSGNMRVFPFRSAWELPGRSSSAMTTIPCFIQQIRPFIWQNSPDAGSIVTTAISCRQGIRQFPTSTIRKLLITQQKDKREKLNTSFYKAFSVECRQVRHSLEQRKDKWKFVVSVFLKEELLIITCCLNSQFDLSKRQIQNIR